MVPSSKDGLSTALFSGIAYLFGLFGITDLVVIDNLLTVSGACLAMLCVAVAARKGRKLAALFFSGTIGSITAVAIIAFTPEEYYKLGLGGVIAFVSIYWLAPMLRDRRRVSEAAWKGIDKRLN